MATQPSPFTLFLFSVLLLVFRSEEWARTLVGEGLGTLSENRVSEYFWDPRVVYFLSGTGVDDRGPDSYRRRRRLSVGTGGVRWTGSGMDCGRVVVSGRTGPSSGRRRPPASATSEPAGRRRGGYRRARVLRGPRRRGRRRGLSRGVTGRTTTSPSDASVSSVSGAVVRA